MKYFIAHRGNINGKNSERENSPSYIEEALSLGLDVEIDVWVIGEKTMLGHDYPQYEIKREFLMNDRLWCHAKNVEALVMAIQHKDKIHCFFHHSDDYTITSRGIIWSYTGKKIGEEIICVMPENGKYSQVELQCCLGICSDHILYYKSDPVFGSTQERNPHF